MIGFSILIILITIDVVLYGLAKKMDPTLKPIVFRFPGAGFSAFFSYLRRFKK
jgi:hypothetical protein